MRLYALHFKFVREYSGGRVPQVSESRNLRPVVEFGTKKWQCIAEHDLVDDIIATCCGDDMERYWSSDVDEVAYQIEAFLNTSSRDLPNVECVYMYMYMYLPRI